MEERKYIRFCSLCMEEHEQILKEEKSITIFKGEEIEYTSVFYYCEKANDRYMTEYQINENSKRIKDAYRKKKGLLTSYDIKNIRKKYELSQKDLSKALDWGEKTITRYESHQVQDKAHNKVLMYIKEDPIQLYKTIEENKRNFDEKVYNLIRERLRKYFPESDDLYKKNLIYLRYNGQTSKAFQGNTILNLDKVIEVINYFSSHVKSLFTVKLMKLLWYSDNLHYKEYNIGITGLKYFKEANGALPLSYKEIIYLNGIKTQEEIFESGNIGIRFLENKDIKYSLLTDKEREILDRIIKEFGELSSRKIVEEMHKEKAYLDTLDKHPISYEYAKFIKL